MNPVIDTLTKPQIQIPRSPRRDRGIWRFRIVAYVAISCANRLSTPLIPLCHDDDALDRKQVISTNSTELASVGSLV